MLEDIFIDMSIYPLNGFPMLQVNFPEPGSMTSVGVSIMRQYFSHPGPNHAKIENGDDVGWLMDNLSHVPAAKLWGQPNQIAMRTRRGRGNALVCNASGATFIKMAVPHSDFEAQNVRLIIDERMPSDRAIICYVGAQPFDRFAALIDDIIILNKNFKSYATVIDLDE